MSTLTAPTRPRRNRVLATPEHWRPPLLSSGRTWRQRAGATLRRFLDMQASSIWRDLRDHLCAARGTVLDVGCGAQPYRGLLPSGTHYVAIDTADARENFGYEMPDTIYFHGSTWPVNDHSVQMILCTEVLEHVANPLPFLREAHRCLEPGGRILITVPFAARWHFIPHDYYRYTPAGLAHLLGQAGFQDLQVYARGNPLTVACYKAMALLLPLLLPQTPRPLLKRLIQTVGLCTLPLLLTVALVANLSLRWDWGDDCLGYTLLARSAANP